MLRRWNLRIVYTVRLPVVPAHVECETINAGSMGKSNILYPVLKLEGECVAHHMMGDNIFARPICINRRLGRLSTGL